MLVTTALYIVLAVIIALAITVFQYFYKSETKDKTIVLLSFLRFLGIFSILLLLINPKIETQLLETVKPKLILAIDNSSSIKYQNNTAVVSDFVKSVKENKKLNAKFDIDYFSFTNDIKQLDSLAFSANKTNIKQSLVSLDNLYKEKVALLLVTDGNQTVGENYSFYKSKSTIFPIIVGDTVKHEDLKISKLNVNKYTFLKNNFPVEIFVNYNGENSINPMLTVKNGTTTVFRKEISFTPEHNSKQITFNLPATRVGIINYKASLSYLTTEVNKINNHKNFTVEVINEQSKIAIISDLTHPDIGMLKRAIETNKQRKVVYLHPDDAIAINEYQLLILYQPTRTFSAVFKAIQQKKINTLIITGTQTDWNFLNAAQQNFSKKIILQTEDYLADFNSDYSAFVAEDIGFLNFSPLQGYFGNVKFKVPTETILYQNIGGFKTANPLLATYTSNNRRGAVLFGENSWKWRMMSYTQHKSFTNFDNFINKLVQYLSVKKKFNQLELSYNPIVYQNEQIKISANYFDSNYTVDNRVELLLFLKNKATNVQKSLPLRLHKNIFQVNLNNLNSGDYTFLVKVKGTNIARSGNFSVLDYTIEQQFTHANMDALKNIAINSGGEPVHINNVRNQIAKLEANTNYKSIQKSSKKVVPLVDWKWLLGLLIFFFSLEWFIRKYRGLI